MIDTDLTSGWTELRTIGGGGGGRRGWEEGMEGSLFSMNDCIIIIPVLYMMHAVQCVHVIPIHMPSADCTSDSPYMLSPTHV